MAKSLIPMRCPSLLEKAGTCLVLIILNRSLNKAKTLSRFLPTVGKLELWG
jgi:hypothetical protein